MDMEGILDNLIEDGDCWIWLRCTNKDGYGNVKFEGSYQKVHRVMYEFWIGPIPKGLYLLHKCDNPGCVRPSHLTPGTQKENMEDCVKKGRIAIGEKVGSSKLSDIDGRIIRKMALEGGLSQRTIAFIYGISPSTVANIKRGYRRSMT